MLPTRELAPIYLPGKIINASVQTDAGCVREVNEDSVRHIIPNDPEAQINKGTLTIVADGMGGHASGEVASAMAIELISEFYYSDAHLTAGESLRQAITNANRQIHETAVSSKKYYGMGTTVVALAIFGNLGLTAHVGDSRVYRLRRSNLELLTLDHSQVMEMVKEGIISFEEAHTHDDKNVILRAVGTQPEVEVEISETFAIEAGDEFLLCSDGLSDMLDDEEILQTWLAGAGDVHSASAKLIEQAKRNGGHDNISVAIVKIAFQETTENKRQIPTTREFSAV